MAYDSVARNRRLELREIPGVLLKEVRLTNRAESARIARAEIVLTVRSLNLPADVAERAELGVSETATNAIVHAPGMPGSTLRLLAIRNRDRLRIEVHDGSRAFPRPRPAGDEDESGRGLQLLAHLADDHGTILTATGKAAWFEIVAWPDQR
ncbi:MAG: hypothetical protein JWN52_2751 [Actinomycetia bacterium]|nr:hypothetical protein [Actinomycetes bacterium]